MSNWWLKHWGNPLNNQREVFIDAVTDSGNLAPRRNHAGRATHAFRLVGARRVYVSVELENGKSVAMLPQAEGWFETEIACQAGTRYRFNIDGEMDVPDPASRAQASDVHGWSVVVDSLAYQWRHSNWQGRPWHEAVIYELHVGAMGVMPALRNTCHAWPNWALPRLN